MPDIAMCPGGDCPQKETCFRFTAMPSEFMQSYFVDPPNKGGECDYYWKVVEYPEEGLFHIKTYTDDTTTGLPKEDSKRRAWHY